MTTIESRYPMDPYNAAGIVEGFVENRSAPKYFAALAYLIKTGLAWQLQGFFGRTAAMAIENGHISSDGDILIDEDDMCDVVGGEPDEPEHDKEE